MSVAMPVRKFPNPFKLFVGQLYHGISRDALHEELQILGLQVPQVGTYIVSRVVLLFAY